MIFKKDRFSGYEDIIPLETGDVIFVLWPDKSVTEEQITVRSARHGDGSEMGIPDYVGYHYWDVFFVHEERGKKFHYDLHGFSWSYGEEIDERGFTARLADRKQKKIESDHLRSEREERMSHCGIFIQHPKEKT